METKEKKVEFYGGAVGVWTPVIVMLIGMIINTVLAGGLTTLPMVTFLAMAVGFLLAKDKKTFGSVTLKGLQNPMFGTEAVAFIFAGILAQLLRQSGLIQALIYVVAQLELNTGLIPLIAFLTCMLISTACGTSTGSVTAVAPVLLPLAFSLDINPGLMCGAIISGAIFGDNLAPISDTTIGSALTQEADLGRVVRTRFPYAAVSAAVSAVLFVVIGLSSSSGVPSAIDLDGSTLPALVLLVLPVIMVVLMRLGWDLMSTLIICNLTGMVLNLVLGTIGFTVMFSASGPISAGMSGMMTLVLYVMLLFLVLEILNSSGAFEQVSRGIMRFSIVTGGSGIAIIFFGSLVRTITKAFGIDRCRGANILDGVACGATGLMPHGNPTLLLDYLDRELIPAMRAYDYHVAVNPTDLMLGLSGCHSNFLPMFRKVAEEEGVSLLKLIADVSAIDRKAPPESLLREVAGKLK